MLVLFDIDGTLLVTQGAGIAAMQDAGREMFGEHISFDAVNFAGSLDPLIFAAAADVNDIRDHQQHHEAFRAAYLLRLTDRLSQQPSVATLLPGVAELVGAIAANDAATLGLLTGNYHEAGRLKIDAAGLDFTDFKVGAWGDDGAHRRDLPGVAMSRHAEMIGAPIDPAEVVIIGDTPHDVDCARHNGCRSLAVATGRFSRMELESHGPDLAVEDLSETDDLLAWMNGRTAGT